MINHWHRVDRAIIYRSTARCVWSDTKQGRWLSIGVLKRRRNISLSNRGDSENLVLIRDDFCIFNAVDHSVARCTIYRTRWCKRRWHHHGLLIIEVDLILCLAQDHELDPVIGGKGNSLSTIVAPARRPSHFTHVNSSGRDVAGGESRGCMKAKASSTNRRPLSRHDACTPRDSFRFRDFRFPSLVDNEVVIRKQPNRLHGVYARCTHCVYICTYGTRVNIHTDAQCLMCNWDNRWVTWRNNPVIRFFF